MIHKVILHFNVILILIVLFILPFLAIFKEYQNKVWPKYKKKLDELVWTHKFYDC
jgi:hypothetical protein